MNKNPYYYLTIPKNDSTEWGNKYENEFRRRMCKKGEKYSLVFILGVNILLKDFFFFSVFELITFMVVI